MRQRAGKRQGREPGKTESNIQRGKIEQETERKRRRGDKRVREGRETGRREE
jgi:hypothetical protein